MFFDIIVVFDYFYQIVIIVIYMRLLEIVGDEF